MQIKVKTKFSEIVVVPCTNPNTDEWDGKWWMTLTQIECIVNGFRIDIPPGFVTNFGSVPKLFRHIVDPADEAIIAFIVHDYLYCKGNVFDCNRKTADQVMKKIADVSGQNSFEKYAAYVGVRAGGWVAFHKNKVCIRKGLVIRDTIDKICYDNGYFPDSCEVMGKLTPTN